MIQSCFRNLEEEAKREFNILRCNVGSNLTNIQKSALNCVSNNKIFQILQLDKNIGPLVVSKEEYLKSIMKHNLLVRKNIQVYFERNNFDLHRNIHFKVYFIWEQEGA